MIIAGLQKLAREGKIGADELTVAYITGARPEDPRSDRGCAREPLHIEPTMASFEASLASRERLPAGRSG